MPYRDRQPTNQAENQPAVLPSQRFRESLFWLNLMICVGIVAYNKYGSDKTIKKAALIFATATFMLSQKFPPQNAQTNAKNNFINVMRSFWGTNGPEPEARPLQLAQRM